MPSSRALLGGLLVLAATAGVLSAHRAAAAPPTSRIVVLTRDVAAGESLGAEDLGTVAAELPGDLDVVWAEAAEQMVGRVARTSLSAMQPLRPDDLFEAGRFDGGRRVEVSIDLPPAQALAGSIRTGDLVDVLATDPNAVGTSTVVSDAVVSQIDLDDEAIGSSGQVRVRLGVADAASAEALVDAALRTDVTLALPAPSSGAAP
jgi:Flp pilus assembly protein CpaB